MIALPDPFLNVPEGSRLFLKKRRSAGLKLEPVLIRQKVRRRAGIYTETEMNHLLCGDDCALSRRDVIPQLHCGVKKSVNRA